MDKNTKKTIIIIIEVILLILLLFVANIQNKMRDEKNRTEASKESVVEQNKEKVRKRDVTLDQDIQNYLSENGIDTSQVAYSICDVENQEKYVMNADTEFVAASVYKLPLAMIYYEKINDGEMSLDTTYTFQADMYEDAGYISSNYTIGSEVPLKELLNAAIVYSDNDAGHILFENLGGWQAYKEDMKKYTNSLSENYDSTDNITTAATMDDVLNYLYKHKDSFQELIENMKKAEAGNYLDQITQVGMPQKYGMYGSATNSVGFVEAKHPYTIVVLTSLSDQGVEVMANINDIAYKHFN